MLSLWSDRIWNSDKRRRVSGGRAPGLRGYNWHRQFQPDWIFQQKTIRLPNKLTEQIKDKQDCSGEFYTGRALVV